MRLAEVRRPTVILLNIGMPKLNGHVAARDIRAQPSGRNITLIAVTAYEQKADKHRSKEAGFDYHIVKPVGLAASDQLLADLHPSN